MKLKDKSWIPVFKAGTWTDASGKKRTFTEEDLDKIVEKYSESGHEAPIVIGHPETNAPAYGWVKNLKKLGKTLFAQVDQIAPEFAEMVDKGLFKKRSISLYPDLTLRHIGFLGAMPPAVKGLPDVAFSDSGDVISFEFNDPETKFQYLTGILRRLREFIISQFGLEQADEIISNYEIEEIATPPEPEEGLEATEFSEKEDKKMKEQLEKLQAELAEKEKQLKEYQEKEAKLKQEQKKQKILAFAEKFIKEGKILPKQKEDFIQFATALDNQTLYNFSEKQTTLFEKFIDFVENQTSQVSFGEKYKGNLEFSEDREDLATKVEKFAKEKNITFKEALKQIIGG